MTLAMTYKLSGSSLKRVPDQHEGHRGIRSNIPCPESRMFGVSLS